MTTNKPLKSNTHEYRKRLGVHKPYSQRLNTEFQTRLNTLAKPLTLRNYFNRTLRSIRVRTRALPSFSNILSSIKSRFFPTRKQRKFRGVYNHELKTLKESMTRSVKTLKNHYKNVKPHTREQRTMKRNIEQFEQNLKNIENEKALRKTRKRVVHNALKYLHI